MPLAAFVVAKAVARLKDSGRPVKTVVQDVVVQHQPHIARLGHTVVGQGSFQEGDVLAAGHLLETERLFEVANSNSPDIGKVDEANVQIFDVGVAAGEVVVGLELEAVVNGAGDEETSSAKLAAVVEAKIIARSAGEVGHDPTAELDLELAVFRFDPCSVLPVRTPLVLSDQRGWGQEQRGDSQRTPEVRDLHVSVPISREKKREAPRVVSCCLLMVRHRY